MRTGVANKRRSKAELQEIDADVERLREFIRLEYLSHEKIAALIGVHEFLVSTLGSAVRLGRCSRNESPRSSKTAEQKRVQVWRRLATSIGNTITGEAFLSRGVVRSPNEQRARFER